MNVAKLGAELQTVGIANLKRIRYATTSMPFESQTQRFIQTASCQTDLQ